VQRREDRAAYLSLRIGGEQRQKRECWAKTPIAYVAMTRACDKLILAAPRLASAPRQTGQLNHRPIDNATILAQPISRLDWAVVAATDGKQSWLARTSGKVSC